MFVSGSRCLRRDPRANCHQQQDPLLLRLNVIMQCDFKDKQEPHLSQYVTETGELSLSMDVMCCQLHTSTHQPSPCNRQNDYVVIRMASLRQPVSM